MKIFNQILKKEENKKKKIFVLLAENEMVFVESGAFLMGSEKVKDEKPIHNVTVSSFYISKYLITIKFYKQVMSKNPSHFKGKNHPVEKVHWYEAIEFYNKLSEIEGLDQCYKKFKDEKDKNNQNEEEKIKWTVICDINKNGYRLPLEAEWEYAARGGNQSRDFMFSGSNHLDEVAWYEVNSNGTSYPVGMKKPNQIGIYDMSGNVCERCWDWYDEKYNSEQNHNPQGPSTGVWRVVRGGGWYLSHSGSEVLRVLTDPAKGGGLLNAAGISQDWLKDPSDCRLTKRSSHSPDEKSNYVGFRIVRSA